MSLRSSRVACLLIGVACWLSPVVAAADSPRLALIVGHNIGNSREPLLRYAHRDAERVAEVFRELTSTEDDSIVVLLDPDLTAFNGALGDLAASAESFSALGSSPTIVFYYAGHGDSEALHLGSETVTRQELQDEIESMPAQLHLLVFDACRTSDVPRGFETEPGFEIGPLSSNPVTGTVVIDSTRDGDPALEATDLEGAVFTHFWVSGLRGAADFDGNGRVTLAEAYTYAYRYTVERTGGGPSAVQRPSFDMELEGTGELELTRSDRATVSIHIPPCEGCHVLVFRQPTNTLVAEAVALPDRTLDLAVPTGRLLIQLRLEEEVRVTEMYLSGGNQATLDPDEMEPVSYTELAARGGTIDLHPWAGWLAFSTGPHRLGVFGSWGYGLLAGVTLDVEPVTFGSQVSWIWADPYTVGTFEHVDRLGRIRANVGPYWTWGAVRLNPWIGVDATLLLQQRERFDSDALLQVGYDSQHSSQSAGTIGLAAGLRTDFDVAPWLTLVTEIDWSFTAVPSGDDSSLTLWHVNLNLGVSYRF